MNEEDAKYCMIDGIPREIILKELETYKKALYMACNGQEYLVKDFLQKAREE